MENKDFSRYEEVETKQNPVAKAFKTFGKYLKGVGYDFISSFKFNNMKLPGWLIAVPGVFIGFFLMFHAPVIRSFGWQWRGYDEELGEIVTRKYLNFDFSGIVLFLLMLFGILNIFTAVSVMKKKNLGSVVVATFTTLVIVVCGALYLYLVFYFKSLVDTGKVIIKDSNDVVMTSLKLDYNYIMSISSVAISMVSSVIGVVLGYIHYDRTYEKVDR